MSSSTFTPLPGRVGNLTPQQEAALEQFKTELTNEGIFVPERHDDHCLLRFLRARKFNIVAAKTMIVNQEKWRKDFKVDEISQSFSFPERAEVDKFYPQFYHKVDKDGRPVYIEILGKVDMAALNKITTEERLLQRFVWEYEKFLTERLPAASRAAGHHIETSCTILDLKGVSIGQFWRVKDYVFQTAAIGQNDYPECMGKFYIINAPFLFSTIWGVIKGWLDPVTQAKISILGSDYKGKLLEQIPAENLPSELGGPCKCEGGCTLSDEGPWKDEARAAEAKST